MAGIVLEDTWKVYADGTEAVRALDLDIADGELMVLVGPSGCGKTTALRMVAGLETVNRGTIRIGDRTVNTMPPKERDIAMVFQNYALYPHMSVFDNMAFGLKLQRLPRAEIQRRVTEAAGILGLGDLLGRRPRALSGGQRQRVAMGRAIVRHPQAFLMDEPLSNLDAKLRVQMRAEIARIQHDLDVTTVYVTHDQIEAMTMGDRVAVIRKGMLQQVDTPEALYERPVNLFVGGFIGSPAMNLVEARLARAAGSGGDDARAAGSGTDDDDGALAVDVAGTRLAIPAAVVSARPALRGYEGRTVVLGIRPEDMEDASLMAGAPGDRRIRTVVELREALGSDIVIHCSVAARPAVTDDVRELAVDVGREALERIEHRAAEGRAPVVARLSPRSRVAAGDAIELVVDTERLHFFDPEDGRGIYGTDGQ